MALETSERASEVDWRLARAEIWWSARLVPFAIGTKNLEQALRYADVAAKARFDGLSAEQIADWVLKATRKPWLMRHRRCLRQGLLGMRFMRYAGYAPELHFGLDTRSITSDVLSAHCWVVLDGRPVLNTIHDDMIVIHAHKPWS